MTAPEIVPARTGVVNHVTRLLLRRISRMSEQSTSSNSGTGQTAPSTSSSR